jgi:hypothetical protein
MGQGDAVNLLSGLRIGIGAASWTTPRLAGRLFGLDAGANPQSPYLARLFGVRDIALAWGTLGSEGAGRRQWLLAGVACDLADALAGIAGARRGYLPRATGAMVTGAALTAAALGAGALRDQR